MTVSFARNFRGKVALLAIFLCAVLALLTPAAAQISGLVREAGSGAPISGAKVRIQALENSPETLTAMDGSFTLNFTPTTQVSVAAFKPYDHAVGALNFLTDVVDIGAGAATGVEIFLPVLPARAATLTVSSASSCGSCHAQYTSEWNTARHSGSARNAWVLDLFSGTGTPGGAAGYVYKNTHAAGSSGFCATCHAPLADIQSPGLVQLDAVTNSIQREGVNCVACHSIASVDSNNINGLHAAGGVTGKTDVYFPSGPNAVFQVFGNLPDVSNGVMQNVFNPLFGEALLCSSCHQYKNPANAAAGQNTYVEWQNSPYALPGPAYKTCQNCHMPEAGAGTLLSGGPQRPSSQRHRHTFTGATPTTLQQAIKLNVSAQQVAGELEVTAQVRNLGAGHNFPTGVSIRNAILVIQVKRRSTQLALVQSAGGVVPGFANDDVAGVQPGDWAGFAGKGYAKVLRGRINGQGAQVEPVLFIDAETTAFDQAVPAGATDTSSYRFTLPVGVALEELDVSANLYYRRAFRALAVTKGWTQTPSGGPVEIEVARASFSGLGMLRDGFE